MSMPLSAFLKLHNIKPKKSLGQNFLVDPDIPRRIVAASGVGPDDRVVEIGPGVGSLTLPLLEKVGKLTAIEADKRMVPLMKERIFGVGEVDVRLGDAVKFDYAALAKELGGPITLVANLPYQISTPLMFVLIKNRAAVDSMTLMFQKELADRLHADPEEGKAYGALSILCQLWLEIDEVMEVPPEAFHPRPKVTSSVLHFKMRKKPLAPVVDLALFSQVVHAAFNQRRKTLSNTMKAIGSDRLAWLEAAGIDPKRRGETLTIHEFARLTEKIGQKEPAE